MTEPRFTIVRWHDAWADSVGAVTISDALLTHKPETIRTVGWLLVDDPMGVSLANEVCGDGSYRGRTFVPRAMIVSVTVYELRAPRAPRAPRVPRKPRLAPPLVEDTI
jgi:hypothetical protein